MNKGLEKFGVAIQAAVVVLTFVTVLSPLVRRSASDPREDVTISRFQRVGAATLVYANDWDNVMPLAMSYDTLLQKWRYNGGVFVPAGWTDYQSANRAPHVLEDQCVVQNALIPYLRTNKNYMAEGMFKYQWAVLHSAPGRVMTLPAPVGIDYNGLLHAWPRNAVFEPSRTPMYTQNYKENTMGTATALPSLCCSGTGPLCQFNPVGSPSPTPCKYGAKWGDVWWPQTLAQDFSAWAYGHRLVFVNVDGSVTSLTIEAPTWPQYSQDANSVPFNSFNPVSSGFPAGSPYLIPYCVQPHHDRNVSGSVSYAGYYRPDNEFTFSGLECTFTGE